MTELSRRIGFVGATAIGVTSMIGAGLFVAFAPASAAAGSGLLVALAIAGLVAACNAISSSRLAIKHPQSGGTYVYATRELSPAAGHVAGWAFLLGKTASCAAMAWAIGVYLSPDHPRLVGTVALIVITVVNLAGVERSTQVMVLIGTVVVTAVIVACVLLLVDESTARVVEASQPSGVLEGAALLFFAFAGYARLSTLGEEVREPARTIPRAVVVAIALVAALYLLSAIALDRSLGADLADASAPFADALAGRHPSAANVMSLVAMIAAAGALLSLCLGVSRTMLAMARDQHLPTRLAQISGTGVPRTAEIAVAAVALIALWTLDLSTTIGFSSCCVLIYYAVANLSAWKLGSTFGRSIATLGAVGCLALAVSLPLQVWLVAFVALGALSLTRNRTASRPSVE